MFGFANLRQNPVKINITQAENQFYRAAEGVGCICVGSHCFERGSRKGERREFCAQIERYVEILNGFRKALSHIAVFRSVNTIRKSAENTVDGIAAMLSDRFYSVRYA